MIADPEGPSFISRTVTRSCMDQLNLVTHDPQPTSRFAAHCDAAFGSVSQAMIIDQGAAVRGLKRS